MDTKEQIRDALSVKSVMEITDEAKRKAAYALNMCTICLLYTSPSPRDA